MYNISDSEKAKDVVKQLNGKPHFFIHSTGYVSEVQYTKEKPLRNIRVKGKVFARIAGKSKLLIDLMLEHFIGELPYAHTISYKDTHDNRIPLDNIVIKKVGFPVALSEADGLQYSKYKCQMRADTANNRSNGDDKINGIDVFNCLQRTNFTCIFCHSVLKQDWHLDHFYALAKGGKNENKNLAASCRTCNLMKGTLDGYQFIAQCRRVANVNGVSLGKDGFSPESNLITNINP